MQAKKNHSVYSKIDVGYRAEKELKSAVDTKTKKKVTDKETMQFKLECKDFLVVIVQKIMDKSLRSRATNEVVLDSLLWNICKHV